MEMIASALLALGLALGATAAAPTTATARTGVVERDAARPPVAPRAADTTLAKGAGGFSQSPPG